MYLNENQIYFTTILQVHPEWKEQYLCGDAKTESYLMTNFKCPDHCWSKETLEKEHVEMIGGHLRLKGNNEDLFEIKDSCVAYDGLNEYDVVYRMCLCPLQSKLKEIDATISSNISRCCPNSLITETHQSKGEQFLSCPILSNEANAHKRVCQFDTFKDYPLKVKGEEIGDTATTNGTHFTTYKMEFDMTTFTQKTLVDKHIRAVVHINA